MLLKPRISYVAMVRQNKKKLSALVGLGIVFGKKPWRFTVRTRYHWTDKHGEFDASSFQRTIGSFSQSVKSWVCQK